MNRDEEAKSAILIKEELDLGVWDEGHNPSSQSSNGQERRRDGVVESIDIDDDDDDIVIESISINSHGNLRHSAASSGLSNSQVTDENEDWCNASTDEDEPNEDPILVDEEMEEDLGCVETSTSFLLHGDVPRQWSPRVVLNRVDVALDTASEGSEDISYAKIDDKSLKSLNSSGKSPKRTPCIYCKRKFRSGITLENHLRTHTGEKPHACPICDKKFTQKANLTVHVRRHVDGKVYNCHVCYEPFTSNAFLTAHMKKHSDDCPRCHICQKAFASAYLEKHIEVFHQDAPKLKCQYCPKSFLSQALLSFHVQKHIKCKDCDMKFSNKRALLCHTRTLSCGKPCCHFCGKGFTNSENLELHLLLHNSEKESHHNAPSVNPPSSLNTKLSDDSMGTGDDDGAVENKVAEARKKSFDCQFCSEQYRYPSDLARHLKRHEENVNKKYVCPVCGLRFCHLSKLNTHKRKHQSEQTLRSAQLARKPLARSSNFVCRICNLGFYHKLNLIRHLSTHDAEPPKANNEGVVQKSSLNSELQESWEPESLQCTFCKKVFSNRPNLIRHTKLHMKADPAEPINLMDKQMCNICGKAFHRLKQHLKIHENEEQYNEEGGENLSADEDEESAQSVPPLRIKTPFGCLHCEKRFITSSLLRVHVKKHSKCTVCGKQCSSKIELSVHARTHANYRPFSCKICHKRFGVPSTLRMHMQLHKVVEHNGKPYTCDICNRGYDKLSSLGKHKLQTHGMKITESDKVARLPSKRSVIADGRNIGIVMTCEECGLKCASKTHLQKHARAHPGYMPFVCKICDKRFELNSTMVRHVWLHKKEIESHNNVPNAEPAKVRQPASEIEALKESSWLFPCNLCSESFQSKMSLQRHRKVHWICGKCGNDCKTRSNLEAHLGGHPGFRHFTCKLCQKTFSYFSNLYFHLKRHEKESEDSEETNDLPEAGPVHLPSKPEDVTIPSKSFSCEFCDKSFSNMLNLSRHEKGHKLEAENQAKNEEIHKRETENQAKLEESYKRESENLAKPFICTSCGRGFDHQRLLTLHSRIHSRGKNIKDKPAVAKIDIRRPFCCKHCPKRFVTRSLLNVHLKMHFKCSTCGLQCSTKGNLKKHEFRFHTKQEAHVCQFCNQTFSAPMDLLAHIRDDHKIPNPEKFMKPFVASTNPSLLIPEEDDKPHVCEICNKCFTLEHSLVIHLKWHEKKTESKSLKMQVRRGKRVSDVTSDSPHPRKSSKITHRSKSEEILESPNIVEVDIKPIVCDYCENCFTNESEYNIHLDTCTTDSPSDVAAEKKKSDTFKSLSNHVQLDAAVEKCEICGDTFKNKISLSNHMRLHSESRPFGCPQCTFRFPTKPLLEKHVASSHADLGEEYKCHICNKVFLYAKRLDQHLLTHTADDPIMQEQILNDMEHDESDPMTSKAPTSLECESSDAPTDIAKNVYECPDCGQHFNCESNLKIHMVTFSHSGGNIEQTAPISDFRRPNLTKRQRGIDPEEFSLDAAEKHSYNCRYCPKSFDNTKSLRSHLIKVHYPERTDDKPLIVSPFSCKVCRRVFMFDNELQAHFEKYGHADEDNPYECNLCDRRYRTERSLKQHSTAHLHEEELKCPWCPQVFLTEKNMRRHVKKNHTHLTFPYRCQICLLGFLTEARLQEHLARKHENDDDKPYACEQCPRRFEYKRKFEKHLLRHLKEDQPKTSEVSMEVVELLNTRGFERSTLSPKAIESSNFERRKEFPFRCPICYTIFRVEPSLLNHLISHTNDAEERPYVCEQCERRFRSKWALDNHSIRHASGGKFSDVGNLIIAEADLNAVCGQDVLPEVITEPDCEETLVQTHAGQINNHLEHESQGSFFQGEDKEVVTNREEKSNNVGEDSRLERESFEESEGVAHHIAARIHVEGEVLTDAGENLESGESETFRNNIATTSEMAEVIQSSLAESYNNFKNINGILDTDISLNAQIVANEKANCDGPGVLNGELDSTNSAASCLEVNVLNNPQQPFAEGVVDEQGMNMNGVIEYVVLSREQQKYGKDPESQLEVAETILANDLPAVNGEVADSTTNINVSVAEICDKQDCCEPVEVGVPLNGEQLDALNGEANCLEVNVLKNPQQMFARKAVEDYVENINGVIESDVSSRAEQQHDNCPDSQAKVVETIVPNDTPAVLLNRANDHEIEAKKNNQVAGNTTALNFAQPTALDNIADFDIKDVDICEPIGEEAITFNLQNGNVENTAAVDLKPLPDFNESEDCETKCVDYCEKMDDNSLNMDETEETTMLMDVDQPADTIVVGSGVIQPIDVHHSVAPDGNVKDTNDGTEQQDSSNGPEDIQINDLEQANMTETDLTLNEEDDVNFMADYIDIPAEDSDLEKRKPFRCNICGIRVTTSENLRRHKDNKCGSAFNTVHRRHACKVCIKRFTSIGVLKRHLALMHDGMTIEDARKYAASRPKRVEKKPKAVEKIFSERHSKWKVKNPVICPICNYRLSDEEGLQIHLLIHEHDHDERPFDCSYCDRRFRGMATLNRHLKFHGIETDSISMPKKCPLCEQYFPSLKIMKPHLMKHADKYKVGVKKEEIEAVSAEINCPKCDRMFLDEEFLDAHLLTHETPTVVTLYDCHICDKQFDTNSELKMHFKEHMGKKTSRCDICGVTFSYLANREKHYQMSHFINGKFCCPHCEDSFLSLDELLDHVRVHPAEMRSQGETMVKKKTPTTIKPFQCKHCSMRFNKEFYLLRHEGSHFDRETSSARPFKCDLCNLTFTNAANLANHKAKHARDSELTCPQCNKIFKSKSDLNSHLLNHMYFSSVQKAAKPRPSPLKAALMSPSPSKPSLVASSPSKTTMATPSPAKPNLLSPIPVKPTVHTAINEDLPFACPQCDKSFRYEKSLEYHLAKHAKTKPSTVVKEVSVKEGKSIGVNCPKCNKWFSQNNYLSKHMKAHSRVKAHKCEQCGKRFKLKKTFKTHLESCCGPLTTSSKNTPVICRCPHCKIDFDTVNARNNHLECDHPDQVTYYCQKCSMVFKYYSNSKRHEATHEKVENASGQREVRVETSSSRMAAPVKDYQSSENDLNALPFSCIYCSKRFKYETTLKCHLVKYCASKTANRLPETDVEKSNTTCNVCRKKCDSPYRLRLHMRIHTGEKPHKCLLCPYRSAQLGNVKKHLRVVHGKQNKQVPVNTKKTGSTTFKCPYCEYTSKQRFTLNRHIETHNDEAPDEEEPSYDMGYLLFPCSFCSKSFKNESSLMKHLAKHNKKLSKF